MNSAPSSVMPVSSVPATLSDLKPDQVQVQVLHNMISKQQLDHMTGEFSSTCSWLIDTGASHHVTGDATALINVTNIPHSPVDLPNGQQVLATK